MPFSTKSDRVYRARPVVQLVLLLLPTLLLAACGQQGGYGYSTQFYGSPPIGEAPEHYYPPPGPPDDPWGPYIREAAARYAVPEQWVRAVMQQESGGQEQAVSPVGAMGLMQVMPETYQGLQARYGLGDDPYDPHNNILAGTAYIREMYERFGSPGFLAGYNAGPDRVDLYLAGSSDLPDETVNYLAAVTPNLGDAVPLSGPLALYASARPSRAIRAGANVASLAAGCDLNRAYDPNHPCSSLEQAAVAPAPYQPVFAEQTGAGGCNLNIAYDPSRPCTSLGQAAVAAAPPQPAFVQQAAAPATPQPALEQQAAVSPPPQPAFVQQAAPATPQPALAQQAAGSALPQPTARTRLAFADGCDPDIAFDPDRPCHTESAAGGGMSPAEAALPATMPTTLARYQPSPLLPSRPSLASAPPGAAGSHLLAIPDRDWAIQVGAFANPNLARAVAENARTQAPGQLRSAALALPPTPGGGSVLYRARLVNLSASAASDACWQLNQRQLPCVVVQPSRS